MNKETNFCKTEKPVLLQRGYNLVEMVIGVTQRVTENFRLNTDRGYLKHIDVIPIDNTLTALAQNLPFTLARWTKFNTRRPAGYMVCNLAIWQRP